METGMSFYKNIEVAASKNSGYCPPAPPCWWSQNWLTVAAVVGISALVVAAFLPRRGRCS